jgi:geranylgeranyl pyrophosphate synthase
MTLVASATPAEPSPISPADPQRVANNSAPDARALGLPGPRTSPAGTPACAMKALLSDELQGARAREGEGRAEGPAQAALAKALYVPVAEFVARPSKQFRGRMVEAGWQLAGGRGTLPRELIALVEALHAGSLIIDDIEDESLERRGSPTLHLTHGVPVALNAGNWLYFWAISLLQRANLDAHVELTLSRAITKTLLDCHQGQALDVSAKITELEQSAVPAIVDATTRLKTGCLMRLSAVIGAIVGGATGARLDAISTFATELGVALQMLDDQSSILSPKRSQKAQEDLRGLRCTWPWAWLAERMDAAQFERLQRLAAQVAEHTYDAESLRAELAEAMQGPICSIASLRLRETFAELKTRLGPSAALRSLGAEISRLEVSYG